MAQHHTTADRDGIFVRLMKKLSRRQTVQTEQRNESAMTMKFESKSIVEVTEELLRQMGK